LHAHIEIECHIITEIASYMMILSMENSHVYEVFNRRRSKRWRHGLHALVEGWRRATDVGRKILDRLRLFTQKNSLYKMWA